MTEEFSQLGLDSELIQTVAELGYQTPTPIQVSIIPLMISGQDVIGQAQTGTGKTAAFALPILQNLVPGFRHVQSLILTPTRELALQVANAFNDYGKLRNVSVLAVYGGQAYPPQIRKLKVGVDIVVGTPGRLLDLMRKNVLNIQHVSTVVLDEADEMLSMGFIEDIEAILKETPNTRQTGLFSATLPKPIRNLAERYMQDPSEVTIQAGQRTVSAIEQRLYWVQRGDKLAALTRLIEYEEVNSALIFVRTRAGTGDLANELTLRGYPAEALSGDLNQEARERTLERFRQNQVTLLVATDVAARGLDIEDISHVVNFDLPDDPEIYVHRIGRTGRAGKNGVAISLVAPSERRRLSQIEAFLRHKIDRAALPSEAEMHQRRDERLSDQVMVWLKRDRCRRERELVEMLVQQGHDPLQVAAVALKLARVADNQRPIEPIGEINEPRERQPERIRKRREQYERTRSTGNTSHEPGMVRISLNLGKKHGIRPNDIVGAIAFHADIPGHVIGKIKIQEKRSLVDVPEAYAKRVLAKSGDVRIRKQAIALHQA